ncbi:hypothetical protein T484DRAFT_1926519 [Baffinella frigidus]|nr:hypothetical protein T484DRAFT_1926519 [Cryptophyta sp. CCMP2293]
MHRRAMEQDPAQQRNQEVVEDLVNDLLCLPSPFVSTTPDPRLPSSFVSTTAETPHRRRRQRPTHLALSCTPLDSPLVWGAHPPDGTSSGASAACTANPTSSGASAKTATPTRASLRAHLRKHSHPRATSRGSTPNESCSGDVVAAPEVRSTSSRKLVATHKWLNDEVFTRSLGRGAPLDRLVQSHSDGELHHAKADTSEDASPLRRSQTALSRSKPAPPAPPSQPAQPAQPRRHWESLRAHSRQLKVSLAKANSPSTLASLGRDDAAGPRSVHLKSAAYTLMAAFPTGRNHHEAGMAVLKWEMHERMELAERKRQIALHTSRHGSTRHFAGPHVDPGTGEGGSRGAVAPPVMRQASGRQFSTSTDARFRRQSGALSLIRKHGFALAVASGRG